MIKSFKAGLSLFTVLCLTAVMLGACAQTGTQRGTPYGNRTGIQNMRTGNTGPLNNTTQYGATNQYGLNGTQYGATGYGNTGYGTTGYGPNNMYNRGYNNYNTGNLTGNGNFTGMNLVSYNRQSSDRIASQIRGMSGVRDARVVVMGNSALVGFTPDNNAVNLTSLRGNIARRVKEIDRNITNVNVSESPDFMNRINRLGSDITNNRPMNTIRDQFNSLMGGITPTTR